MRCRSSCKISKPLVHPWGELTRACKSKEVTCVCFIVVGHNSNFERSIEILAKLAQLSNKIALTYELEPVQLSRKIDVRAIPTIQANYSRATSIGSTIAEQHATHNKRHEIFYAWLCLL